MPAPRSRRARRDPSCFSSLFEAPRARARAGPPAPPARPPSLPHGALRTPAGLPLTGGDPPPAPPATCTTGHLHRRPSLPAFLAVLRALPQACLRLGATCHLHHRPPAPPATCTTDRPPAPPARPPSLPCGAHRPPAGLTSDWRRPEPEALPSTSPRRWSPSEPLPSRLRQDNNIYINPFSRLTNVICPIRQRGAGLSAGPPASSGYGWNKADLCPKLYVLRYMEKL